MRFSSGKSSRNDFEVVITSMLDINFLLIMFFMVTAQFQREIRAVLDLPNERGDNAVRPDEAGLVININAAGDIVVANRTIELAALTTLVRAEVARAEGRGGEPVKLMLRVDRNAASEQLNRVVTMLKGSGVAAVRVATQM
jgi:biopolymer transport protein ExbD